MVGLLTERSARTLLYYLQETNLNVYYWLQAYMQAYPIPRARHPLCAVCCETAVLLCLTHALFNCTTAKSMEVKATWGASRMVRGMTCRGKRFCARCCRCRPRAPNLTW